MTSDRVVSKVNTLVEAMILCDIFKVIYSGDWIEGRFQGNGSYISPNGDTYVGKHITSYQIISPYNNGFSYVCKIY